MLATTYLRRTAGLLAIFSGACIGQVSVEPAPPSPIAACISCHGENGIGISDELPALGGQHERYLIDRLKRFSLSNSGSDLMRGVVSMLDDKQIKEIASHFSRLPYVRNKQAVDPEAVKRGEEVYLKMCQLCHTAEGRSSKYSEYPLLAGQNLPYLRKAMGNILSGDRRVDAVKQGMLSLLHRSPEAIDDALNFFASQEVAPEQMAVAEAPRKKKRRRLAEIR